MNPFRLLSALTLSATLIGTAHGQAAGTTAAADGSQQIEGIAAIVNDVPVSYSDVRQRARLLLLSLGGQATQQDVQRITGQALQQLIDEKLQLQEAQKYELEVDIQDIYREIDGMSSQMGLSRDQFYQQLFASGVSPTSLEEQMRAEIAWRRIMSGLYGSRIRISENQIDDQMSRIRASARETQYLLSEIFLFAPDAETQAQALEAANSIRQQLVDGAAFSVAAQRFSSAPTAATGGDMGWVSLEDVNPAAVSAIEGLGGQGITPPITADDGIYIYALRSRQDPGAADTEVTLTRVLSRSGDEAALAELSAEVSGCDGLEELIDGRSDLEAAELG
ncbi:MAG: SurA N-terminal domain-containing protein, partial [Pseudomonadota bacterium]